MNRKMTTIVVGPDGKEYDLGAGERIPKKQNYITVNAFRREVK